MNSQSSPVASAGTRGDVSRVEDSNKPLADRAGDLIPVSLTLLGLLQAVEGLKKVELFVDELLAVASALFLATLLLTRLAARRSPAGGATATRIAQLSYDLGLVTLSAAAVVLAIGYI